MYYKAKREYLFVLPIDSEHIFCYLIENRKKNKRSKYCKKGRKGEQTDEYEKQEYT